MRRAVENGEMNSNDELPQSEEDSSHRRYLAAGSADTPVEVLVQLAEDSCAKVRRHTAENPLLPIQSLTKLAYDSDIDVRLALIDNHNTPQTVFLALAADAHDDVRYGLAESYKAPLDILYTLMEDHNPFVAARARKTVNAVERGLEALIYVMEPERFQKENRRRNIMP